MLGTTCLSILKTSCSPPGQTASLLPWLISSLLGGQLWGSAQPASRAQLAASGVLTAVDQFPGRIASWEAGWPSSLPAAAAIQSSQAVHKIFAATATLSILQHMLGIETNTTVVQLPSGEHTIHDSVSVMLTLTARHLSPEASDLKHDRK